MRITSFIWISLTLSFIIVVQGNPESNQDDEVGTWSEDNVDSPAVTRAVRGARNQRRRQQGRQLVRYGEDGTEQEVTYQAEAFFPSGGSAEEVAEAPEAAYEAPEEAYEAPEAAYEAPEAAYEAPEAAYEAPEEAFEADEAPEEVYDVPEDAYEARIKEIAAEEAAYEEPVIENEAPEEPLFAQIYDSYEGTHRRGGEESEERAYRRKKTYRKGKKSSYRRGKKNSYRKRYEY